MSGTTPMLLAMIVPTTAGAGVALCGRWPNLRETVTLSAAAVLLWVILQLLSPMLAGEPAPAITLGSPLPGLVVAFRLEPLGMLFALIAAVLWLVSSCYSIGYMRANDETNQTRFYVCFALAIACTLGIAFAANLFTLFLFYEALTLVTYPLVTHHGSDDARRGGRVYLGMLLGTSIAFLLPALAITWFVAGTLEFAPGGILTGKLSAAGAAGLLALFVFGIGKAALMPVHRWLPAAMVAPTPVSALLHAVAVVKAGVFTVVKVVVYVFGTDFPASAFVWLPYVAGFTIVAASVVALRADNLKRRLAYSTVSQLAYVVMSVALLAPLSVLGAVIHIAAHAVGKITLFFAAGALYTAGHLTRVSELDGVGRRMPWTMTAFAIAALSMIGLPPAAGFISKWFMVTGAFDARHWPVLGVILLSTLLNAAYFLPVVYRAFFVTPAKKSHAHGEAPAIMVAALAVTAALTVLMFFFPDLPLAMARGLLER